MSLRRIVKDEDGYERLVWGEVLIPDQLNVYGDYHTKESVRQFAYIYMLNGFGIQVFHDTDDVSGQKVGLVESFIARDSDDVFIPGSWVVGVNVFDDDTWEQILTNEINGFSYEAFVAATEVNFVVANDNTRFGTTEPDLNDGHRHHFFVLLDAEGRVISGGTTGPIDDGVEPHEHEIDQHTFTNEAWADGDYHSHIYNFVHQELYSGAAA